MSQTAAAVQEIFAHGFLPASLEIADSFTLEAARKDAGKAIVPSGSAHLLVDLDGQEASRERPAPYGDCPDDGADGRRRWADPANRPDWQHHFLW